VEPNRYFYPRLIDSLQGYDKARFKADLYSGVTVGVIALPLAIAFAIASGAKPEAGIFTAIIAGFIISAFGGSRVQVGGPTGAFIVIVYGIILQYGYVNLLICTVMAGIMLLMMGLLRMGSLIKFFPRPLVTGFTSGIAVLIILSQVTLILGTLLVSLFNLPVETIGTRFGGIPQTLPSLSIPPFEFSTLHFLMAPAMTIALLGAIESLLSASVADGMIDDKHDPNQELMAQGLANMVTPFFGGLPATGAIARTAVNVRSGATSPISGIVHALTLLIIVLVAAPMAKHIPLATLSGILLIVGLNMGEWESFTTMHRYPKSDSAVLMATFLLTVIIDLTVAVEVGMFIAIFTFIQRITALTHVSIEDESTHDDDEERAVLRKDVPEGVVIYRVFGALFFGAADKLETVLLESKSDPDVLILKMHEVISMDASALHTLEHLFNTLRKRGKHLILCGPHTQPYFLMHQAGFFERVGRENVVATVERALFRAKALLNLSETA